MEKQKTLLSEEKYLELERKADYKSEYYKGEIFALAGAGHNHNVITSYTSNSLINRLKKNYTVYNSEMRLYIENAGLYTYPDIMVVCGEIKFLENTNDNILNPNVIIEVLSKSTESYDRGKKFEFYRTINSLKEYILISQSHPMVEVFTREDDKWILSTENKLDNSISINSIQIDIPLNEIYAKVEFNEEDNKLR